MLNNENAYSFSKFGEETLRSLLLVEGFEILQVRDLPDVDHNYVESILGDLVAIYKSMPQTIEFIGSYGRNITSFTVNEHKKENIRAKWICHGYFDGEIWHMKMIPGSVFRRAMKMDLVPQKGENGLYYVIRHGEHLDNNVLDLSEWIGEIRQ